LNYLLGGRDFVNTSYNGSAITSTSASWVAVDTTNARITTGTVNSTRVKGLFSFPCHITFSVAGTAYIYFSVYVDATTNLGNSTYGLAVVANAAQQQFVSVPFISTGLSVATHTFDLYWKLVTVSGTVSAMRIETAAANGSGMLIKQAWEF
jgi:predicted RecA/RadA family phage recombinase